MGPGGMGGEEGSSGEGSEVLTAREWRGGKGEDAPVSYSTSHVHAHDTYMHILSTCIHKVYIYIHTYTYEFTL